MAKRSKKIEYTEADVPISAMIDVVFLLLIYFIVTQKPIIENTFLIVDLPAPDAKAKPDKPPKLFTIDVAKMMPNPDDDLNVYYVNQQKVSFEDLQKQLIKIGELDPKQTIIVNCDPNARHQKLIQVLDACAKAGLVSINVVNDLTIEFQPEPGTRTK